MCTVLFRDICDFIFEFIFRSRSGKGKVSLAPSHRDDGKRDETAADKRNVHIIFPADDNWGDYRFSLYRHYVGVYWRSGGKISGLLAVWHRRWHLLFYSNLVLFFREKKNGCQCDGIAEIVYGYFLLVENKNFREYIRKIRQKLLTGNIFFIK